MVLQNLIMETAVGQLIMLVGCVMGLFAAIDSDWKDARELAILSYNNYPVQVINRILFMAGAILCLFVDFPSRADWFGKAFNFILFPALGFFCFCLAWALTYNLLRAAIWVLAWCFEKKN